MIEARTICDSIGGHSPRLLTLRCVAPKFCHQETLRHRLIYIEDALRGDPDFSFSVSSARAIPFARLLEEVRDPARRAMPVKWGAEKRGMSMGGELDADKCAYAEELWDIAARSAAYAAERMADLGLHKSIVNRVIEPYIHVHCLMTATEPGWMNFFGLRLDEAADPTLRALAEACWACWCESTPMHLSPGQYHLPFIELIDVEHATARHPAYEDRGLAAQHELIRMSVARCARLSYESFDTGRRSTIDEDLALYQRLVGGVPIHASPAEHQATPDYQATSDDDGSVNYLGWAHPELAGNLGPGWVQYRKRLSGEVLAPLPEEYRS